MVPALAVPAIPSCRASSFLKYSSATSHARSGGFSSGGGGSGLFAPIGEGIFGTKDDRREGPALGVPGASPRSEDVEDFLTRAGEDDRLRLTVLELRRIELGGKLGDEGVRRGSAGLLGDCRPGDCGKAVFAAVWRERRFSGCERRFASLFVCRAGWGVFLPAPGAGCCW